MQRGRVVRHQRRGLGDQRDGLPQREASAGIDRPPAGPPHRSYDGLAQLPIVSASHHDDGGARRQPLRQLREVRPPLAAPDRSGRERHECSAGREAALAQHPFGGGAVRQRRDEHRRRLVMRLHVRQREQPVDLMPGGRPPLHLRIQQRPPVVEADAARHPGEPRQRRRAQGPVGKIRRLVTLGAQGPGEGEQPREPSVRAALVVRPHPPHGGVRLDQRRRRWRGDDVQPPVALGERGQQRRRQHHVAQESGLDEEGRSGGSVGHGERGI